MAKIVTNADLLVSALGYAAAMVSFLVLAVLVLARRQRTGLAVLLAIAAVATALWSLTEVLVFFYGFSGTSLIDVLDVARVGAWLLFLALVVKVAWSYKSESRRTTRIHAVFVGLVLLYLGFEILLVITGQSAFLVQIGARIVLSVAGLIMIENIMRSLPSDEIWRIKFLCIGLGVLFCYDIFVFSDALLFRRIDNDFMNMRGLAAFFVSPLFFMSSFRHEMWRLNVYVSQKFAFHSTALIASGFYLVLMSLSAWYLSRLEGSWVNIVQFAFLFGAIIVLLVITSSGATRASMRMFTGKYFYRQKYDYREEWARFTSTVSDPANFEPLEIRIIKAIADIVESPGGALFEHRRGQYLIAANWSMSLASILGQDASALTDFFVATSRIIEVDDAKENPASHNGLALPEAIGSYEGAWLVIPLFLGADLTGLIVLAKPRVRRSLDWEDLSLLQMTSRHAASYISEHRSSAKLDEVEEFDEFNRRFAFVVHDLKNLMSQFSLALSNFEKFGDNPEFRHDTLSALKGANDKIKSLIEKLGRSRTSDDRGSSAKIWPIVDQLSHADKNLRIKGKPEHDVSVTGDPEQLSSVLGHLLENARQAAGEEGRVALSLAVSDGLAIVEISDNGSGMDPDFIRDELFKPFRSTKSAGLGIGAYQCREYIREIGGDLEVVSAPDAGTTVRITIPTLATKETETHE
jgi:putative PEP-CTERM system histidine kinase